ncbi:NfeD family protein [Dokdonella sp.]|uniref:NfeD family protein n=1 Tax=Dokdonella sp. TaxID=2291710 RepID=UPI0031BCDD2F|nr:NfeD family protein [Dokdonella sp.]
MDELLTHYGWWLLSLVLIAAEVMAPGYFMLWIGIAAGFMGLLTLVLPGLSVMVQAIVFALLSLATCLVYWKYIRPLAERRDDQPLLNRRGQRMIGRRVLVCEAIVNGRGKVKVGDGEWLAEGPDLPLGAEVEIVALQGTTFTVREVGGAD